MTEKIIKGNNLKVTENQLKWYIFYTCPRAEKSVYHEVVKKGYDVFLPVRKELRVWKNRQKKWTDCILFPGYIFIYTEVHEIYNLIRTPKIVTNIHCAGVPSFLRSQEIEGIRKILDMDQNVLVENNFSEGEKVRIIHGPLTGYEGILQKQKGKTRFGIQLKEINHTAFIDINISLIEKIL